VVGSAAERRKRHFSGDECGEAAAQLLAMDEFGLLGGAATKAPKAKAPKANKIVILE
jgi:hypothetical protein